MSSTPSDRVRVLAASLLVASAGLGAAAVATGVAPRAGTLLLAAAAFAAAPALVVAVLSTAGRSVGDALAGDPWVLGDAVETAAAVLALSGVLVLPLEAGTVSGARPLVPPVSGGLFALGLAATTAVVLGRAAGRRLRG